MGNAESHPEEVREKYKQRSFPGSAIIDKIVEPCGNLNDTLNNDTPRMLQKGNRQGKGKGKGQGQGHGQSPALTKFFQQADAMCAQSPMSDDGEYSQFDDEYEDFRKDHGDTDDDDDDDDDNNDHNDNRRRRQSRQTPKSPANPTSALFARALINEVTDNPKTMTPVEMAQREYKLLKAQERAKLAQKNGDASARPVGAPGGVGKPSVMGSIAHALTGSTDAVKQAQAIKASVLPPNIMSEKRAQVVVSAEGTEEVLGENTITIGLCLSRRSTTGHPETVTRQTAFDFNELQDREYKYVSSTDSIGWRAGGGEPGGGGGGGTTPSQPSHLNEEGTHPGTPTVNGNKKPAMDTVHIPIIHIDADSPEVIAQIVAALARGEIFIPHMAIMPEALSVNGVSPPDLVVRFGTERNDDLPPDEWTNWCLEFMHNQLYEYFYNMGARWMKRPFSITLAKKVRWKTVKHMNRYFAHAEQVVDGWREKGPQHLDPQLAYIEGGATPEEVARPHGIYLFRNGIPTNYFAPNFDPPYTTKMTRNLLLNVLDKSWDRKRREWTSEPIPKLITPGMLVTAMCGCSDGNAGGFLANEVTNTSSNNSNYKHGNHPHHHNNNVLHGKIDTSTIPTDILHYRDQPSPSTFSKKHEHDHDHAHGRSKRGSTSRTMTASSQPQTPGGTTDVADTDIMSEAIATGSMSAAQPPTSANAKSKAISKAQAQVSSTSSPSPRGEAMRTVQTSFEQLKIQVTRSDDDKEVLEYHDHDVEEEGEETMHSNQVFSAKSQRESTDHFPVSSDTFPGQPDPSLDVSIDTGVNSAVQESVTNTNTTIMHTNVHAEQFMKRELSRQIGRTPTSEEKKEEEFASATSRVAAAAAAADLVSDEDWLDNMGQPLKSPARNGQSENEVIKEALEKERARQIALVAMAQEQSKGDQENKSDLMKAQPATRKSQSPSINKNNSGVSGVSLDYSVDSQSFLTGDGSTTLLGGKFTADGSGSVSTMTAQQQHRRTVDPLAMSNGNNNNNHSSRTPREDDEVSGISIQESTSSVEVIPSDEELFAVGWAKALDPKSGSYYFFTLDRSKIVWDNPLSTESTAAGSLPEGTAVI